MHTLTLQANDDAYTQLMAAIKTIGKVLIIEDKQSADNESDSCFDFGTYQVTAFNNVDPVSYQRTLRNEW
jgi:hypothetical protein